MKSFYEQLTALHLSGVSTVRGITRIVETANCFEHHAHAAARANGLPVQYVIVQARLLVEQTPYDLLTACHLVRAPTVRDIGEPLQFPWMP